MSLKKVDRMTLGNYINSTQNPFYDELSTLNPLVPAFIKDSRFQEVLSGVLIDLYGEYFLRDKFTLMPDRIKPSVMNWYAANAYKFQGLYDTTQLEYEPLENYSMTEEGEDSTSGDDTTTHNIDARKVTNVEGQRTNSETKGSRDDTTTNSVSPYEQSGFTNRDKTDTAYGQQNNSYISGGGTDTTQEDKRTDTDDRVYKNSTNHRLTRRGNIGITTSQQMLESQRSVLNFSIYQVIAKEIMMLLCLRTSIEHKYIVVND